VGREVGNPERGHRPRAGDLGVVVHGQGAVGREAHVELHPVGAAAARLREGLERVLDEAVLCATPMSKDGRHGSTGQATHTNAARTEREDSPKTACRK